MRNTQREDGPLWQIGLYIRLSREDGKEEESESVVNQEKILHDFVCRYFEEECYSISGVYADDSRTGMDIQRPEFQRMERDIQGKKSTASS